ncbi:paraneoplastic antigen Ma1 homolog [Pelodiscus sinensis]|uniref:paraneoplastic antigen Ma1 homolog n=1 Tax=Pelodiscus sinensis TaxID=13735 RepID=UPI003F6AF653
MLGKVPIDTEDAIIYQALGTVKILPPEVGIVGEVGPWPVFLPGNVPEEETTEAVSSDFAAKLNVFLQKEGKSLEDVRTIVTPASMSSAITNEGLIAALGKMERSTPPSYEGVGYRKLRFFSGIHPTPVGEDDFESWMDQAAQMIEEWQCSDIMKRQRLAESLRGPAYDVIRSLRMSKPSAGAMEYLHTLDDIYGTTESGDLYLRFCTTYQDEGEKLSQYVCRLEKLLHNVLVKKGILASRLDQVRMEQILKGACSGNLIALKLQLSDSRQNPPSFSKLVRDIREEEDRLAAREARHIPMASACTVTSVAPSSEIADLKEALRSLTEQVISYFS